MGWSAILALILQNAPAGIALVEDLFKKWSSGTAPIQADFDALRAMANQSAYDRMKAQLLAAGIALTDPTAIALLKLVS